MPGQNQPPALPDPTPLINTLSKSRISHEHSETTFTLYMKSLYHVT